MLLSVVLPVGLRSILINTPMQDSKSLNTSLLEVMISSINNRICFRHLSDLTLQIIFDAWWASLNVDSKLPVAWINCRHAPSWRCFLHCGLEETGSPGIISIVSHQVRRHSSEHGTSSMWKHFLAKAHIAKLNKLTKSDVTELTRSTVDETALALLKRQGSQRITLASSQSQIIYDIQVIPYWPKWQTKRSTLVAKDFETSEFHQDTWNRYLLLGFVSAHIAWNAISNLELPHSYIALCDDLVLPSAMTLSNIGQRKYALTVNAIKKQLPSCNIFSLALDRCTSMNKLAITSVIAYYMDENLALCEVQLPFYEVDRQFFSTFESYFRMIDQGPTHWSQASRTFEGCAWSFGAYQ